MALWVALEFLIRALLPAILVVDVLGYRQRGPAPEWLLILGSATTALALVLLGALFWRRAGREGLTPQHLGYDFSPPSWRWGFLAGAALFALVDLVVAPLDIRLSGVTHEVDLRRYQEAGIAALALMPLVNVLLAPPVEEFAWRGYIQGTLAAAWGPSVGLLVTASLFAAKHVLADFSLDRVLTLTVGALVLGLVRQRRGTAASTLAHAVLNLTSEVQFLAAFLS